MNYSYKTFILFLLVKKLTSGLNECGISKLGYGLIYGGRTVLPGEWPWLVPLFFHQNNEFFCSSNLISHQHLLTAAHCMQEKNSPKPVNKENIYAYVGIYDLEKGNVDPVASVQEIKRISIHSNWNPEAKNYDSDIALLTLLNNVVFSQFIQPICLPEKSLIIGERKGNVVGYGKSESPELHEFIPRQTQIPTHSNDYCFFMEPTYAIVGSPSTFCAGEIGKNPCSGDSGGGFYIKETYWKIIGIVSSALVQDCAINKFVLFTNVALFVDWIQQEMNNTNDNENSSRNSFFNIDEETPIKNNSTYFYTACKFELSKDAYTCHIDDLMVPDNDISLAINNEEQHQLSRSNRDVTTVQIYQGLITHFPETSKIVEQFPNMSGFSITFTKLKYIYRSVMTPLKDLKYFLISDNDVELIPSDTFYDMQKLEFIDICRNKVSILDPNWTATMPKLRIFKARSNLFKIVPKELFMNNPMLEEVLLDKNQIQVIEKDFSSMRKLRTVAMLQNRCINIEYCKNGSKDNKNCVKNLRQFTYLVYGLASNFIRETSQRQMIFIRVAISLILSSIALVFGFDECGIPRWGHGLIYGGETIHPGEWPWLVPLFFRQNNEFFCSSNLISHQHLLTVAHCVHKKHSSRPIDKESIYAYVGIYNLNKGNVDPVASVQNIKRIAIHKNWNSQSVNYDADIALLTLYNYIQFTQFIQPICLPDKNFIIGEQIGEVVGYGKSESSTPYEYVARKTRIPSHSNDHCFFTDPIYATVGSPSTFCAGEIGKNPCHGDSGSGFFIKDTHWRLVGLVSSALVQDCAINRFVLFTKVALFIDWIQLEMTRTDESFSSSQNSFYNIDEEQLERSNAYHFANCNFELTSDAYTCHINNLITPDNQISLAINNGEQHHLSRSNRDVTTVQMKNGHVMYFPEMSKVVEKFPNMNGYSITFTKLKHIKRSDLAPLKDLKYFLISDNDVEVIPSDTFYDMQKLEFIDICRNKVTILDPNWTATMPKLRIFKARSNLFKIVPKELFMNNPILEEILLDKNQIQVSMKDFSSMRNLRTVAMLQNRCINIEYCKNGSKDNKNCVKNLRQFTYLVYGFCGINDE
ncbi:hypothetical protein PVAND_006905 [Polypedilum vanderplanki]|uniref:Peptidase S1 domain-containing protein n=1 Tax=Polypedilum vanderplanki TaxID=319348 RepID=A0A9J6C5L3_POLVA|nr:hypothetical protein PVAND_006905 [Polypedilum vanderplanki]